LLGRPRHTHTHTHTHPLRCAYSQPELGLPLGTFFLSVPLKQTISCLLKQSKHKPERARGGGKERERVKEKRKEKEILLFAIIKMSLLKWLS
jgi:hypothetical protein